MNTITLTHFKTHFSKVIKQVRAGLEFTITDEQGNEVIGYFLPKSTHPKAKRQLGILEGKASASFANDFKMTAGDFPGS